MTRSVRSRAPGCERGRGGRGLLSLRSSEQRCSDARPSSHTTTRAPSDAVPIPCTAVTVAGKAPTIGHNFVAPSATLAGDVKLGSGASVWYGAVVRAHGASVSIGELSNVQENATVVSAPSAPVSIGKLVTIGAGSLVNGATLLDGCSVGPGCVVSTGASIGAKAVLAAGSVLPPRATVPAGQVCAPAQTRSPCAPHRAAARG